MEKGLLHKTGLCPVCSHSFGTAMGWEIQEPFEIRFIQSSFFIPLKVLNRLTDLPKDTQLFGGWAGSQSQVSVPL